MKKTTIIAAELRRHVKVAYTTETVGDEIHIKEVFANSGSGVSTHFSPLLAYDNAVPSMWKSVKPFLDTVKWYSCFRPFKLLDDFCSFHHNRCMPAVFVPLDNDAVYTIKDGRLVPVGQELFILETLIRDGKPAFNVIKSTVEKNTFCFMGDDVFDSEKRNIGQFITYKRDDSGTSYGATVRQRGYDSHNNSIVIFDSMGELYEFRSAYIRDLQASLRESAELLEKEIV